MSFDIFQAALFHLRRISLRQPYHLGALLLSVLLAVGAAYFYVGQWQDMQALKSELEAEKRKPSTSLAVKTDPRIPVLPSFTDTQFVAALNQASAEEKVPVDEIVFALEDNANRPYLQYRANMSLSTDYGAVRRFIDSVLSKSENSYLDAISCTRDDIGNTEIDCQLGFAALYRRDGSGG